MFLNISDINFTKNQHVRVETILKKHIYFLYTSLVIMKHVFIWTLLQSQYRLVFCLSFPHLTKPLNPTCSYIICYTGTAEGEGLVGPRPHHFFAPPPPLFALKRKIIKIKKRLETSFFRLYSAIFSVFSLISNARHFVGLLCFSR